MLQQINNLVQQTQDIISKHWSSSLQQHLQAAIAQPTITTDKKEYGIPIGPITLAANAGKDDHKSSKQPSNSRPPGSLHTCTPWTLPGIQSAMTFWMTSSMAIYYARQNRVTSWKFSLKTI